MKDLINKFCIGIIGLAWATSCNQGIGFSETDPEAASTEFAEKHTWHQSVQKVDILVVVDNSTSMAEEQKKMGDRIGSFLSVLTEVDWQLGITTTDVSNGKYGIKGSLLRMGDRGAKFITSETANPEAIFKKHIRRDESEDCGFDCPSPTEEPLTATKMAISKHAGDNRGFFRGDAQLAVIIISDEDEKSSGPDTATKPQAVVNQLKASLGSRKSVTAYGIVIQPWDRECLEEQNTNAVAHYGQFVQDFADQTGGLTGSLCDTDYSQTLAEIGQDTRVKLKSIKLKYIPIPESVEIQFTPAHETSWQVDGKVVHFDEPPPNGTQIQVDYEKLPYGG